MQAAQAALAAWATACLATALAAPPVLLPIRQGEQHGLIAADGRVLLPAEYDEVLPGDPLIGVRRGPRTAYVDHAGRTVVAPQEAWTQPFHDGLIAAPATQGEARGRWGHADAQGRWVTPPQWDEALPFVDGLALVARADDWGRRRWGAIDRSGRLVVPATHEKLLATGGGLLRSEDRARRHRVLDAEGRDITPDGVDFAGQAREGRLRVWSGPLQGFMDATGRLVVPPRYAQAGDFHGGRARVWVDGRVGFIDRDGRVAVAPRWEAAEDFADGLALVREGGRSRFIDAEGRVVLEPQGVDRVGSFADGLAPARVGRLHGYIDRSGRIAIAPRFSVARPFQHGLAWVLEDGRAAYIDREGRAVWRAAPRPGPQATSTP